MNRRRFIEAAAITGAAAFAAPLQGQKPKDRESTVEKTAGGKPVSIADRRVKLGKTGIVASLISVGTGTIGGGHQSNQTRLGQEAFTAMIRHARDCGIFTIDCADQYGSHTYIREALKGLPRDSYVIQTKSNSRTAEGMKADLDRFRKELGVDYIDIVLMHVVTEPDWNTRYQGARDVLSEAKQKGIIRAHGCSCHSFAALETASREPWVDVDLARFNPWGAHMDASPDRVLPVLKHMRQAGKGVVGMKILAQGDRMRGGDRLERARESVRHALETGAVDMMSIGFESPRQIDEIVKETRVALAEIERPAA